MAKVKNETHQDEDVVTSAAPAKPPLIHDIASLTVLVQKQDERIKHLELFIARNHSRLDRVCTLVVNAGLE